MRKLRATFERAFNVPWSVLSIPDGNLDAIDEGRLLFGSGAARRRPILTQREILAFDSASARGYFLVGFWGHGVNSYAFYYQKHQDRARVCFRLPYGGVYMDSDAAGVEIGRFLQSYLAFENRVLSSNMSITAIEAMGQGRYVVEAPGHRRYEHHASLMRCSDFASALGVPE